MRIAYLDCFSGISGDMLLGALVDAGVPVELLRKTAKSLNVGAEIDVSRVLRNGISATKVDVIIDGVKDAPNDDVGGHSHEGRSHEHGHSHPPGDGPTHSHEHTHEHSHADGTKHSHAHSHEDHHDHGDEHSHEHSHSHDEGHSHTHEHRGLKEIRQIIGEAAISETAKKTALKAFELLGAAEAKIHDKDIETIHFHEVGSADAIVDIVCGAVAVEYLKIDRWVSSALNVGGGTVKCAHGTLPVPAPATLELLKGAPVYSGEIKKELVTPTGAALVRAMVAEFGTMPRMNVEGAGYGAGARDFSGTSNVLRVTIGEMVEANLSIPQEDHGHGDTVTVIEANLDDLSPQVFGYAIERLLQAGALEAFGTAAQMKKSRPGTLLTVITRPEDAERISKIIFDETTTIGIRMREEKRQTLEREFVTVKTQWGAVKIKVARMDGVVTNFAPEYEDARRIAVEHAVPLKTVLSEANKIYLDDYSSGQKRDEAHPQRPQAAGTPRVRHRHG